VSDVQYPTTDVEEIKAGLARIEQNQLESQERLDQHATAINAIGGNLQWLVDNAQGIFQMFASPQFMSQMTNMLMGGIANAGPDANAGTDESASGTNG
jgi:hypothetical protein